MAGKRPAKKLRLFHALMRDEWEEWQYKFYACCGCVASASV